MTDEELTIAFETCSLPRELWTHRAHVRVAFVYLRRHTFDVALDKVRSGIQAYNAHSQVPENQTSGYNETTTHAFLHLIHATMAAYERIYPTPTGDSFCDRHPQLMTPQVLRLFYSPKQRTHPLAKTQFVEPDLCPLPRIL